MPVFVKQFALDAPALAGMGLISAGAALVYLPAGLIVAGLLLILMVIDSRS